MGATTAWFLPNRGVLTNLHIPDPRLVEGGTIYTSVFDFDSVAAWDTARAANTFASPFLLWALVGYDSNAVGHRFAFYHQMGSFQRELFMKLQVSANALGTAQRPAFLKEPYLIDGGESIAIELRNMADAVVNIQVCLIGTYLRGQAEGKVSQ